MNTNQRLIPVFAAACLLTLSLHNASADEPSPYKAATASRTVHFGDLDLATPAGRKELKSRIRAASWQACHEVAPRLPGLYMENAKCRIAAESDALNQVFGEGGKADQLVQRSTNQAVLTAVRPNP